MLKKFFSENILEQTWRFSVQFLKIPLLQKIFYYRISKTKAEYFFETKSAERGRHIVGLNEHIRLKGTPCIEIYKTRHIGPLLI